MTTAATVDERLTALEQAVANIELQLAAPAPSDHWLNKVIGSISDELAFREALEYGRAFRNADRPGDDSGEQP